MVLSDSERIQAHLVCSLYLLHQVPETIRRALV